MERPVEVAVFQRGELQSVRALSRRHERRAAALAASLAAALVLLAMLATAGLVSALDLIEHAPTFITIWLGAAACVAWLAGRRAAARVRRFSIGARIDADAFGSTDVELVRRVGTGDDYDLGLVPGMTGALEHGRSPLAIEALTRTGAVRMPLPSEGKVRIEYGASTFVVRRRPEAAEPRSTLGERVRRGSADARRLFPLAASVLPVAALVTALGAVPSAMALSEADMRSSISSRATQWEVEQQIRSLAQKQVATLHQCFDPLPLACQRQGYVGVGLKLARDGEVRGKWVSRSTYGDECPVSECMAAVVSQWYFEPMPEPMTLVLPIQVRRTNRPLYDPRATIAHPVRIADPSAFAVEQ